MADWARLALESLRDGQPCALVSVLAVEGSTPREAGTRMVVTADTVQGSIGGGNLEFQAIHQARAALVHPQGTWRIQDYPLGPLLAQCCGGRVRVMVERLDDGARDWLKAACDADAFTLETHLLDGRVRRRIGGEARDLSARGPLPVQGDVLYETIGMPRMPLAMFGAGHVGVAVARVLAPLPFAVAWFDTRPEVSDIAGVNLVARETALDFAGTAESAVLILTHDHQLDYELSVAALRGRAGFIGVIGSQTKAARFRSRLLKDGFAEADAARIVCPVGLPDVAGKAPDIIAISIAAQLLMLKR